MEVSPRHGHSDGALTRRRPVDTIENAGRLRETYGAPSDRSLKKQLSRLDKHCRDFIARSPFVVIASADTSGRCDASPKGDAPGFVRVMNDETLLIPDRLGNNRVDTLGNLVAAEEIYFHCGKALIRSDLWNPDKQIGRSDFPSPGRILADQIGGISVEESERYTAE